MRRLSIAIKKFAIFSHRWMGVAFCLLFMWWFISGIFMMYWTYPAISATDRLQRAPKLDAARVRISPADAAKAAGLDQPTGVRLTTFDTRPVYILRAGRGSATVFADTGEPLDVFSPALNTRTVTAWAGQPASNATREIVTQPDQWLLGNGLRAMLPLTKYTFPDGQQLYLNEETGQIVQYTTLSARIYAHLGAIPHWLYYTPLRLNTPLWSRVVIWSSGIATVASTLGLIVGIWMLSPRKKYRHAGEPTMVPYTGQKRLHTILGLFFGVLTMTWAFSGMLSMEPFEFERPPASEPAQKIQRALSGGRFDLARYSKHPKEVLSQLDANFPVKELEFSSFAGEPVYHAKSETETLVVPVRPEAAASLGAERIIQIAKDAGGESEILTQYDRFYLDRTRQDPLPVVAVQLQDGVRLYVDPKTARIAGRYSASTGAWVNRWLYHGLHSLDFPWLYNNRPLWDVIVLALMGLCVWLCWTSIVLSWRVLKRKVAPARRAPSEDLAL